MRFFNHYKTIVISDIQLGTSPEYLKKLIFFIKNSSCDKLIFCGDIVNNWQFEDMNDIYHIHNKFIKTLFKIAERDGTKIIFVTANDVLLKEKLSSLIISSFQFTNQYSFQSFGSLLQVIPGDITEYIKDSIFNLYPLNNLKYNLLLKLNKSYNSYRFRNKKEYHSLLKKFNSTSNPEKYFYNLLPQYKSFLTDMAIKNEFDGIICGHATHSGIYNWSGMKFFFPGYWTESLTALTESNYGKWGVIDFNKVMEGKLEALQHSQKLDEIYSEDKEVE